MADNVAASSAPAPVVAPAATKVDPKAAVADPKAVAPVVEPTEEYKVGGKIVKLTKAQAKAYVEKSAFANQQMESVKALKDASAGLLNDLKTPEGIVNLLNNPKLGNSPSAVLKKLLTSSAVDDDTKTFLQQWVWENGIKQTKMTPEQIKQENDLKRLQSYEEKEAKSKTLADEQAKQQGLQRAYGEIRSLVTGAINADKTFPMTEGAYRQVVEKLRVMNKQNVPVNAVTVAKALEQVKLDHKNHQIALFDSIQDDEELIKFLGPERASRIAKTYAKRITKKNQEAAKLANPIPAEPAKRKPMNSAELKAYLDAKMRD